jgi:iron transport multicopper oxidase
MAYLNYCRRTESGLAATFIEAPVQQQGLPALPSFLSDQCAQLNMPSSGNAAGHNSTTDFSGLTTGPGPQQIGWYPKCVFSD